MSERRVKVVWEIDMFPADEESEHSIAKQVQAEYFKGDLESDSACVFKVIEGDITTMVDLSQKEESREQRLERLTKLLLSQIHDTAWGPMSQEDLLDDSNPVTRQLKAMLSGKS